METKNRVEYAIAFTSKVTGNTVYAMADDLAEAHRYLGYYRYEDGYADARIVVREWRELEG